jgi:hypothetical protein
MITWLITRNQPFESLLSVSDYHLTIFWNTTFILPLNQTELKNP